LIDSPVADCAPETFLFTRTSFPIPGRVKEPAFFVSKSLKMLPRRDRYSGPLGELKLLGKIGHTLGFSHWFFSHFGPPSGWGIRLDKGSILKFALGSKQENPDFEIFPSPVVIGSCSVIRKT
jgi:hypothetical protein